MKSFIKNPADELTAGRSWNMINVSWISPGGTLWK